MRYGTSHFVSRGFANLYYARQHEMRADVQRKLDAAEIHIGEPALKPGQRLSIIPGEGRYAIEDDQP